MFSKFHTKSSVKFYVTFSENIFSQIFQKFGHNLPKFSIFFAHKLIFFLNITGNFGLAVPLDNMVLLHSLKNVFEI